MSDRANNKQAVRAALAGGAMTYTELKAATGLDDRPLGKAISNLISGGEASRMGRGPQASIALKTRAPAAKSGKARRGAKARRRVKRRAPAVAKPRRDYGAVLEGMRGVSERLRRENHVRTTLAALEAVIGVAEWPFAAVLRAHQEAVALLTA